MKWTQPSLDTITNWNEQQSSTFYNINPKIYTLNPTNLKPWPPLCWLHRQAVQLGRPSPVDSPSKSGSRNTSTSVGRTVQVRLVIGKCMCVCVFRCMCVILSNPQKTLNLKITLNWTGWHLLFWECPRAKHTDVSRWLWSMECLLREG